jgi:hypothetical protein
MSPYESPAVAEKKNDLGEGATEFRRRTDECRFLAATARNASDRNFWLGRVERWQALGCQNARLRANLSPGHRFGDNPKP